MKGAIYPLTGLLVIAVIVVTAWAVTTLVQRRREARAVRAARWEPYTDIKGAGIAEVGIRLVARWGHHEKTIRYDRKVEEVTIDGDNDLMQRIEAESRALMRAEAYNSVQRKETE